MGIITELSADAVLVTLPAGLYKLKKSNRLLLLGMFTKLLFYLEFVKIGVGWREASSFEVVASSTSY